MSRNKRTESSKVNANMFQFAGGDVDMMSEEEAQQAAKRQSITLGSPLLLKRPNPSGVTPALFLPPARYEPNTFSPSSSSQTTHNASSDPFALPVSGPTAGSAGIAETFAATNKSITNTLPTAIPSEDPLPRRDGSPDPPPPPMGSSLVEPTTLSRSTDLLAKQVWNLHSLDAVIVSANFLKEHINDLLWIKARLLDHQGHLLRCHTFAQQNLDAITRALYVDSKMEELRLAVASNKE
ncbi:hypothetical protein H1R20_g15214, partial [Candolleomyces eurysporus]